MTYSHKTTFGFLLLINIVSVSYGNIGSFWHVTDFHWDPTYRENQTAESCPSSLRGKRLGRYGDYLCDAPWTLVNSSVNAMKKIEPNPDFIIWTGDDTPHIYSGDTLNTDTVIQIILNETQLLKEVFPGVPVYAALGNHDYHPKNQLPGHNNTIYDALADAWKVWMNSAEAEQTFRSGGYYVVPMYKNGYKVVVLNTNLYYESNQATKGQSDPAGQYQWLETTLANAKRNGDKVHIIGHIPLGMFEKHRRKYWLRREDNERLIRIFAQYSDVIVGMYFAHHHTDSFRILTKGGEAVNTLYLAPAVSPWATTLPGVVGSASNNPAIRLFKYDSRTTVPTDIWQYFLNLTETNDITEPNWQLLYKATTSYNMTDLSPKSWENLLKRMKVQNSQEFRKYIDYNGVGYSLNEKCDGECRNIQLCSVEHVEYSKYDMCMNSDSVLHVPMIVFTVLIAVATTIIYQ